MAAHVDVKQVVEAIKALRTIERKHLTKKSVKSLLEEDSQLEHDVYLQFTLKKIPYNKNAQWIRMQVSASMLRAFRTPRLSGSLTLRYVGAGRGIVFDHVVFSLHFTLTNGAL
ncbi:hypothetical protein V5799_023673 [Amblyomma americanum]|uniref:Uncharacterized protein n=1 Tax=Amblyomma americanum TaxID=6943 RepID=A0AAQ4FH72_AMBAM